MKERPIIFSDGMVRAILEGRKTQTRRVCKPANDAAPGSGLVIPAGAVYPAREAGWIAWWPGTEPGLAEFTREQYKEGFLCLYGVPGDRLWVREMWMPTATYQGGVQVSEGVLFAADLPPDQRKFAKWKSPYFLKREQSRITLELTEVRVERLQAISEEDCCRELGAPLAWPGPGPEPYKRDMHGSFARLWNTINAKRGYSWAANPWVWVLEFKAVGL